MMGGLAVAKRGSGGRKLITHISIVKVRLHLVAEGAHLVLVKRDGFRGKLLQLDRKARRVLGVLILCGVTDGVSEGTNCVSIGSEWNYESTQARFWWCESRATRARTSLELASASDFGAASHIATSCDDVA